MSNSKEKDDDYLLLFFFCNGLSWRHVSLLVYIQLERMIMYYLPELAVLDDEGSNKKMNIAFFVKIFSLFLIYSHEYRLTFSNLGVLDSQQDDEECSFLLVFFFLDNLVG